MPVQIAATNFGIFTVNQGGSGPGVVTDANYAYILQMPSLSVDQNGNLGARASFYCTARAGSNGTGQFSIPPPVLLSLPVSAASNSATPSGFLGIGSSQSPSDPLGAVRGIDVGFTRASLQIMKNVTYVP